LNVIENVWQFMRDNWLSNRVFQSHNDIVAHCRHAWNCLVDQPWRIMSIRLRKWARGSQSIGLDIRWRQIIPLRHLQRPLATQTVELII
jgi:hypothetical protein